MAGKQFELLREPLSVYWKVDNASISRRSPLRTLAPKIALTDNLEAYLVAAGKLKDEHRRALAQARSRTPAQPMPMKKNLQKT
jgi:hypothetical protein